MWILSTPPIGKIHNNLVANPILVYNDSTKKTKAVKIPRLCFISYIKKAAEPGEKTQALEILRFSLSNRLFNNNPINRVRLARRKIDRRDATP